MLTAGQKLMAYAIIKWIRIVSKERKEQFSFTMYDVENSALLQRILENKQVYEVPPPLSFKQPWYDLYDNGFSDSVTAVPTGGNEIYINGHREDWEILYEKKYLQYINYYLTYSNE